jgi:predicted O-methyltransferase YrrM
LNLDLRRILSTVPHHIEYFLLEVDDHALHAPLVYDFYRKCICGLRRRQPLEAVEELRGKYLKSDEQIEVRDFGAGGSRSVVRSVARIAANSASTTRTCLFLQQLVAWLRPGRVVELGTSLGFSAMYLAADKTTAVTTVEGCPNTAAVAARNFQQLGYSNIELLVGPVERHLPEYLEKCHRDLDLVFLDANHRKTAVLQYIAQLIPHLSPKAVVVVDDIRWSAGMKAAWEDIRKHPVFRLTADLGRHGVLFTHGLPERNHYFLRF